MFSFSLFSHRILLINWAQTFSVVFCMLWFACMKFCYAYFIFCLFFRMQLLMKWLLFTHGFGGSSSPLVMIYIIYLYTSIYNILYNGSQAFIKKIDFFIAKTYSTQIKSVILQLFSTYILTEYTYEGWCIWSKYRWKKVVKSRPSFVLNT